MILLKNCELFSPEYQGKNDVLVAGTPIAGIFPELEAPTGEIAVSDHRSSVPTTNELIRIAEHSRVGGMLGGKAGIVNIHMGDSRKTFQPIHEAVANSELKYSQFLPTHCNRNSYIFEDAREYGKKGFVDITASSYPYFPQYEIKPSRAVRELLGAGVKSVNIV